MNTKSKSRKIVLIILTMVLIAFLAVSAWLTLPISDDFNDAVDIVVNNTAVTKLYSSKPYIIAETEAKAKAYANKLGIPEDQFVYTNASVMTITDGVWTGMSSTDVINKYVHLLLPNAVKTIDAGSNDDTKGIFSVKWLSITADEGSNLESFVGATSAKSALGRGWLERLDLSKATKLTEIPAYTFKTCDRLYDVALPNNITSIGEQAIVGNALCHISLPSGLGADGSGLNWSAFNGCGKLVEVELPSNANSSFISKVQSMTSISGAYMNVYVKGAGRSWLVRTVDGFVFCKNLSRTTALATELTSDETYKIGKWYLVGYQGPESGGDTVNTSDEYNVKLPTQVDLAKNSENRAGQFDYLDCSGNQVQNDFSEFTTQAQLGENVAVNGATANADTAESRVIAGTQGSAKLRYDIGQQAFYYRW
ncbi:MAG: leucine-rich repeat domain-containing protein, partial [Clostridia bacterium]|nr:leucine-rich repeat domain-containing protein [Clostridia bacterium]